MRVSSDVSADSQSGMGSLNLLLSKSKIVSCVKLLKSGIGDAKLFAAKWAT